MGDCKKILYGVSDYAEIRKSNGWFIDRTGFIRDLENTAFAMFLRPRRFGKSLLMRLAPKGDVKITRLSVVFHGGNLVLCNEI